MSPTDSVFDPKKYEKKWWSFWVEHGLFRAEADAKRKPFTILMPPPNVTSQLHMGHGTCYTFMDLLIRWKRMQGFTACWLPGTDHAGIATQMMVERDLWDKEKKRRQDMPREAFEKRCQDWKEKYGGVIYQQFEEIGFSADWDRKAYTMDPHLSKAVRHVFVKLYEEDLIYRGERLVNWDPVLRTAVSDDEVYSQDVGGNLWFIKYPLADNPEEFITIATTRPETMLGDTAVAVHPDDERFKAFIGKDLLLPLVGRRIKVIADDYVKSEFGTGAVKITPAHDPNDFAIGKRHQLQFITMLDEGGCVNQEAPERFRGMDRFVARKEIIKELKALGLLEKDQPHKYAIPHSDRSKAIIEPRLSMQWYVKMASLSEPAAEAARDGRLRFFPDLWKKTYLYWLDNIQDWCISRQLWWGHRVPVWYCQDCQHVHAAVEAPTQCSKCSSKKLRQDDDVLDTWFSSWLWPLSPFGWPDADKEKKQGLDYFYPSHVLITAPEIIFQWVARMVMAGLKFKGALPFRDIYFSATVTDKQGRKFSKTLGNGIDPMEVIDAHGADAVRFTGVSMAPLGGRISMDKSDFEVGAKFVNKLWNASRFLTGFVKPGETLVPLDEKKLDIPSKWLLAKFNESVERTNQFLENYRLNDAVDEIYHFIWGNFCDWGLETAKPALNGSNQELRDTTLSTLIYVFDGCMRLAHPVIPFITEELWQKLPHHPNLKREISISIASYPVVNPAFKFEAESKSWQGVINLISAVRSVRQQMGISPKEKLQLFVKANAEFVATAKNSETWVKRLANAASLEAGSGLARPPKSLCAVGSGFECYIPAEGLVDFDKERARVSGEISRIEKIVAGIQSKLANPSFVDRAPEEVVFQTKAQESNLLEQVKTLKENLTSLG